MKIFQSVWQNLMTAGLTVFVLTGCGGKLVDVNVTIVDQKTALENQILGSYEELSSEVLLLASVRSVDEEGKLKPTTEIPKGKLKALRAMQRQEFNRDDIQEFKQTLCAGEGNDGTLNFLTTHAQKPMPNLKNLQKPLLRKRMKTD